MDQANIDSIEVVIDGLERQATMLERNAEIMRIEAQILRNTLKSEELRQTLGIVSN